MQYKKNETSVEMASASLEDLSERIAALPGYKPGGALQRLEEALLDVVTACPDETVIAVCDVFYDPGLNFADA